MSRPCFTVIVAIVLVGCSGGGDTPELANVSGKVTLDGDPLPNATLTFTPLGKKGGRPSVAVTDDGGNYELKYSAAHAGATPGKYRVQITTATTKTDESGNDVDVPETLPAKYNANSELEKDVEPGSNTINFELDSKGKVYKEKKAPRQRQSSPVC